MLISIVLWFTIYFTQNTPLRVGAVPSSWNDTDKPPTPRAFCVMDTTIWKDIPEWEGFYEASNTGLIRSSRKTVERVVDQTLSATSKILRPGFDKDCYLDVRLSKLNHAITFRIHLLVAAAFDIPNPENKPFLDHINGVRWDNRVENLRWVTQGENLKASYDFGRKIKHGRTVDQFDLKGNFIKRYRVVRDVEKDGFNSQSVNRVALGKRKTAYGFIWKTVTEEELKEAV